MFSGEVGGNNNLRNLWRKNQEASVFDGDHERKGDFEIYIRATDGTTDQ